MSIFQQSFCIIYFCPDRRETFSNLPPVPSGHHDWTFCRQLNVINIMHFAHVHSPLGDRENHLFAQGHLEDTKRSYCSAF